MRGIEEEKKERDLCVCEREIEREILSFITQALAYQ